MGIPPSDQPEQDLDSKTYVYWWADGVYFNIRGDNDRECMLVIIGATAEGHKELLAFYDFPASHWVHLRTTNPIESTFAMVRLRTVKTRGCVSRSTILAMVFKLVQSAQNRWKRLKGYDQISAVLQGVRFVNGVPVNEQGKADPVEGVA